MTTQRINDQKTIDAIHDLLAAIGGDPSTFEGELVTQMVQSCLKLIPDAHDTGQLKLINSVLKEIRYAYRVFNKYVDTPKVTIFGSARTPETHSDYHTARDFSKSLAAHGWMSITGAGDGIMKAGHEGPQREASFGLSIRLPFETSANEVIEGDPKLINFRYFFTRKLMFMSHADAVAVFPGGFGTQDELFETLTLVQTGKSNIIPVVLIENPTGVYWKHWHNYIQYNLLDTGMISPEDPGLYYIANDVDDALDHIIGFYRVYHSSRYVGPNLVLRLRRRLSDEHVQSLNEEFFEIIKAGRMEQTGPLEGESDHLDLPRLTFHHTRHAYGFVRRLIDRINEYGKANETKGNTQRPAESTSPSVRDEAV